MFSYALTLALSVSLAQPPAQPGTQPDAKAQSQQMEKSKIDGQWEVVYIEMDGKKVETKNFANVSIQGNKLTCKHEGKEKSWTLEFGPHHRVRAEETSAVQGGAGQPAGQNTATSGEGARDRHSHGVYIASKDYLCLSMNHGRDTTGGTGRQQPTDATTSNANHGAYGSHFVLILHRADGTAATNR